jgi:selenocysteine-specific elongation factor
MSDDAPLTLGTAGHIDHGKTTLIGVLTGVDTDRLPAEKTRGISIELGYAPLSLPSGRPVSVVDVPGHERFVRTMVAGATGIDAFLMTVAADDGVMPQTREHAAVLRALRVDTGVVAITKSDLADPDDAAKQARLLLPDAETVVVSARTGAGIDELWEALERALAPLTSRAGDDRPTRLHVDRVFTIRGAGTVVTGTLWSGSVGRGDELLVLPRGLRVRVRGVQVHDQAASRAAAGQRVAVNLVGVQRREIARGDVLADAAAQLDPTYVIDVALELDAARPPLEHGTRIQVHHGTRETPARVARLGGRFFQLRLERPLLAAAGDRFVVRQIAPPDTLGGGVVLDPGARKHGTSNDVIVRLTRLARGEPADPPPAPGSRAAARRSSPTGPGGVGAGGGAGDAPPAPAELSAAAVALEARLREAWLEPPLDTELDAAPLTELRSAGRAVRVGRTMHYHSDALAEIERRVVDVIEREGSITLARLRDELHTSRKFAQALLEHLDSARVTRRLESDARVLRAPGPAKPERPGF